MEIMIGLGHFLIQTANFWMEHLLFINIILSIVIVFFERRDPKTVWAWLLVLYFIPILGIFLYFIIGYDFHKRQMFRTKEIEDAMYSAVRGQEESIFRDEFAPGDPRLRKFSDTVLMNLEAADAVYTADNDVEIYTDGKEKFRALYQEMEQAEKFIHIQYYIIRNDELWQPFEELLARKVKEGVEVRLLYDSMGCRKMRRSDWKRIRSLGIQVGEFFPALLGSLQLRINYRNHRKIVVIDGRTAFVGGFNIGREYLGLDPKFGYWRDTHLRIRGSAVLALHIRFILDWNYATKQNLFARDSYFTYRPEEKPGNEAHPDHFQRPGLPVAEYPQRLSENDQQGPEKHPYPDALFHPGQRGAGRSADRSYVRRRRTGDDSLQARSSLRVLGHLFLYRRPAGRRG